MKRCLWTIAALTMSAPTLASEVGVSVNVAQPDFYGRVEIGNLPPPQLVYAQPIVVQPLPAHVSSPPIYLHVPPGHAKNWYKHCARYNACGQPVYFVQETWYRQQYVPAMQHHGRDDDHDHDHGHGNGHGKGHGKHKD